MYGFSHSEMFYAFNLLPFLFGFRYIKILQRLKLYLEPDPIKDHSFTGLLSYSGLLSAADFRERHCIVCLHPLNILDKNPSV